MMYLSKGIVCSGSTEKLLKIAHGGYEYELHGKEAELWLDGRFEITKLTSTTEERILGHLQQMGLVECEHEENELGQYRILTNCILCPAKKRGIRFLLPKLEQQIMTWLTKAGLRLSTAELVYLVDRNVEPSEDLLYTASRQALVERIYTVDTIADNVLENQMEAAVLRNDTVQALLHLLRKKRIVVL